ncbi:hypothetical protein ANO11243_076270 [Dothideomycetidae sp. 11243]|nr:hypothetical protein ANO11243_076270 [fungal sp. No.11243]
MAFKLILAATALAASVSAQSSSNATMSTTSLYLGNSGNADQTVLGYAVTDFALVASVVDANRDATTYAIECTSGCPSGYSFDATVGASTMAASTGFNTAGATYTMTETCSISTGTASCVESVSISVNTEGVKTSTSTVVTSTGIVTSNLATQVVITAGLDKLSTGSTVAAPTGTSGSGGKTSGATISVPITHFLAPAAAFVAGLMIVC